MLLAELGMNDRCVLGHAEAPVANRVERLPFDDDEFGGVFGMRARVGDDGNDRLSLEARDIDNHRPLARCAHAGEQFMHGAV